MRSGCASSVNEEQQDCKLRIEVMKTFLKKINKFVPAASMVIIPIGLISAVINIAYVASTPFADWFNTNVSSALRMVMAYLTAWIPFSLAEYLIIALPIITVALVVAAEQYAAKSEHGTLRSIIALLSIAVVMYSVFVFEFGAGYRTTTLDKRIGLEDHEVTPQELYDTMNIVVDEINALESEIFYAEGVGSVMPFSHEECVKLCTESYKKLSEEYSFIPDFSAPVKQIILSPYMTYTHISGVYSFFTGEANLNTNYPFFINAYTVAHEMAHQRGIARENEANFIAYLVCITSDNAYMRYAGYMNMYEYLADALYAASPSLYAKAAVRMGRGGRHELKCYSEFFDKYRDNAAADVSDAVNNTYLESVGTEGSRSYGLVVDLAVAYHSAQSDNGDN